MKSFYIIFIFIAFVFVIISCENNDSIMPVPEYNNIVFLYPNPAKTSDTLIIGLDWYGEFSITDSSDTIEITLKQGSKTDTLKVIEFYKRNSDNIKDQYLKDLISLSTIAVACDIKNIKPGVYYVKAMYNNRTNTEKEILLVK